MAFCRRCGDIVAGVRCQCGGTAVAPVVPWKLDEKGQDRWSKTYVQRAKSVSPTRPLVVSPPLPPFASNNRFPRPISSDPPSSILRKSHTSPPVPTQSKQPSSPLKSSATLADSASDILPSIDSNDNALSKVYGSVLQRPETLETHSCAICSSPFPPDATIYPDPVAPNSSRYLCRPCFEHNGGSKGTCPACSRPVLTLKSEGGFIHASGSYWHKRCFNCAACHKNIGDTPMVDLFGRPSCPECFDSSLKRDPTTPKKIPSSTTSPSIDRSRSSSTPRSASKAQRTDEGSPAVVEELQRRLGIANYRDASPVLEEFGQKGQDFRSQPSVSDGEAWSSPDRRRQIDQSPVPSRQENYKMDSRSSPIAYRNSSQVSSPTMGSPAPAQDAINEMKQRFIRGSSQSPCPKTPVRNSPVIRGTPPLRLSRSSTSLHASPNAFVPHSSSESISPYSPLLPSTPDLMSDFSDLLTQLSFPDSPKKDSCVRDLFGLSKIDSIHSNSSPHIKGDYYDGEVAIAEQIPSQTVTPARSSPRIPPKQASTPLKVATCHLSSLEQPFTRPVDSSVPDSCVRCKENLFSIRHGGKFITVPQNAGEASPMAYHVQCFTCVVCKGLFKEAASGQAVFVKANGGACHIECAPVEKITAKTTPTLGLSPARRSSVPSLPTSPTSPPKPSPRSSHKSSSRLDRPSHAAAPPTSTAYRRFGNTTSCPGCKKAVSPMEHGVVPGPQGARWHASCLVCGGKREVSNPWGLRKGREKKGKAEIGCGKKLDSAAKSTKDGNVWCRECLLSLGMEGPQRLGSSHTDFTTTQVPLQLTGTTTLARHFTGLGAHGEPALLKQLTGGGLSPTRSISPTKQLGGSGGLRTRPKSVIGMRGLDEGRGMFLVRQLTGAGG